MKIVFCATYYQGYLNNFFKKEVFNPETSYSEMLQKIKDDNFGVYGSYVDYANKQGHEALLILSNIEPLQKLWAKEVGFTYDESKWEYEIAIEQVKRFKPEVFFLGSMFHYYTYFLESIKDYCTKIVTWISCPLPESLSLQNVDMILSSLPSYVQKFQDGGKKTALLPAAFDGRILEKFSTESNRNIPLSFIGGLTNGHDKRGKMLNALAKTADLHWFGYLPERKQTSLIKKLISKLTTNHLEQSHKGEVWGMEMYATLRQSQITFNAHIDIANGHRVNMRMYEATGMGTLLLTDRSAKDGLNYFKEDEEVVCYSSVSEAVSKIKYYIDNPKEIERIAKNGQRKTLDLYNYDNNMQLMTSHFSKLFSN